MPSLLQGTASFSPAGYYDVLSFTEYRLRRSLLWGATMFHLLHGTAAFSRRDYYYVLFYRAPAAAFSPFRGATRYPLFHKPFVVVVVVFLTGYCGPRLYRGAVEFSWTGYRISLFLVVVVCGVLSLSRAVSVALDLSQGHSSLCASDRLCSRPLRYNIDILPSLFRTGPATST